MNLDDYNIGDILEIEFNKAFRLEKGLIMIIANNYEPGIPNKDILNLKTGLYLSERIFDTRVINSVTIKRKL